MNKPVYVDDATVRLDRLASSEDPIQILGAPSDFIDCAMLPRIETPQDLEDACAARCPAADVHVRFYGAGGWTEGTLLDMVEDREKLAERGVHAPLCHLTEREAPDHKPTNVNEIKPRSDGRGRLAWLLRHWRDWDGDDRVGTRFANFADSIRIRDEDIIAQIDKWMDEEKES